jgi:hypothetical protein
LTFADEITFLEMNLKEFTRNLSLYRYRRNRFNIAYGGDFDRHQFLRHPCNDDRDARRRRRRGRIRCATEEKPQRYEHREQNNAPSGVDPYIALIIPTTID